MEFGKPFAVWINSPGFYRLAFPGYVAYYEIRTVGFKNHENRRN